MIDHRLDELRIAAASQLVIIGDPSDDGSRWWIDSQSNVSDWVVNNFWLPYHSPEWINSGWATAESVGIAVAGGIAGRYVYIGVLRIFSTKAPSRVATGALERHHQLPRQFADKFKRVGLNIEDYTVDLPKAAHRLKPDGLHVGKGAENWNGAWKQFFSENPNASRSQILNKLSEMRKSFGLE